ncbi:GNAT family N-acetyltransferase [Dactylosporangium fulvum]|uniref:GNAT family N-acetyltransferase n=1 Tax=Dactylosporangium fulvum TaxID=53359 RepID=A0ABY5W1G9_9ACTN|nr:GNAT family N-acetyltransferase [Dactylosporangium fulvum]UWP82558.1 GNAT family N-acetyltransferase [Dactylosporangium fulvum]
MTGTPIRRATLPEVRVLAELVAEAFEPLPVCQWLVPNPAERRRILEDDFEILVHHAVEHGVVHTTDDHTAVAVWYTGAPEGVPDIPDYDERLLAACGVHTPRFQQLDEAMHKAHPLHAPHDHLVLLAVSPQHQGAGLGGRLLDEHHAHLDRQGVPGYLEASSPGSRALYLRHGYTDFDAPFGLPDGGPDPAMWPMWRDPR